MKRLLAIAVAVVLVASPAWAQRTELSLFAGYTTPGDIEKKAPTVQDLEIEGAFTWGLRAGHFFTTNLGVEASWARQESELVFGTAAGNTELFELHLDQLQASFVYQFAGDQSRLRPFLAAGRRLLQRSRARRRNEALVVARDGTQVVCFPASGRSSRGPLQPELPERHGLGLLRPLRLLPGMAQSVRAHGRRRLPFLTKESSTCEISRR
jgi:hypothetical protein